LPEESVATPGAGEPEYAEGVREASAAEDAGDELGLPGSTPFPALGRLEQEAQAPVSVPSLRNYERIPLEGARGLGMVRVGERNEFVKVLDLSRGGVCLLINDYDLPESFQARLQVPFLPDVELTLHRVYSHRLPDGKNRVGCSFVPISKPGKA